MSPARIAVPAGLFAAALLIRLLPWTTVYEGPRTIFMGNDAYYHMRRVVYGLHQFPDWLDFDPYLNLYRTCSCETDPTPTQYYVLTTP